MKASEIGMIFIIICINNMRVIYNNIIPFKGYKAINLFGILFARNGCIIRDVDLQHESIHTKQMQEMLYIFFYIWYVIEWLVRFLIMWNFHKAYRAISFEQEAFTYQHSSDYLNNRKHYTWFKYIF